MRIAVIGSWRGSDKDEWRLTDGADFSKTAAAIGERVVQLGHSLIVGSDGNDTADYHAARGGATAANAKNGQPRIHILAPSDRDTFLDLRRQFPFCIPDVQCDLNDNLAGNKP